MVYCKEYCDLEHGGSHTATGEKIIMFAAYLGSALQTRGSRKGCNYAANSIKTYIAGAIDLNELQAADAEFETQLLTQEERDIISLAESNSKKDPTRQAFK
jgi:hypothetical protein